MRTKLIIEVLAILAFATPFIIWAVVKSNPENLDIDGDGYLAVDTNGNVIDCDDGDPDINPGAPEQCDQVDNNCDHQIDEGFDLDGDCYTTCDGDCNDNDASLNLDDVDQDGYSTCDGDCDDSNVLFNPMAFESYCADGVDNDCDGLVDQLDRDCKQTWIKVQGSELSLRYEDVFSDTQDPDEVVLVGYSRGRKYDWSYDHGRDVEFDGEYLTADFGQFGDGVYRVTMRTPDSWADLRCMDMNRSKACYNNTEEQGYGTILCLRNINGQLSAGTVDDCSGI